MIFHLRHCRRCRAALWSIAGLLAWRTTCVVVAGVFILLGDPRSLSFHAAGIYCAVSAGVVLGLTKRWGKR